MREKVIQLYMNICFFLKTSYKFFEINLTDIKSSPYVRQLMICVATAICTWVISLISVSMIALMLTKLGKVMSWYARPAWLFFLYICPTVTISMTFLLHMGKRQRQVSSKFKLKLINLILN